MCHDGNYEFPDRNRGVTQDGVAPHHEPAPARARTGSATGVSSHPVPSFEALYAFLRERYLHSRFEGRNGPEWGANYSDQVTQGSMDQIAQTGTGIISPYESASGRIVEFDASLTVLNPDEPPAQIQARPGNLTHIYGGGW